MTKKEIVKINDRYFFVHELLNTFKRFEKSANKNINFGYIRAYANPPTGKIDEASFRVFFNNLVDEKEFIEYFSENYPQYMI